MIRIAPGVALLLALAASPALAHPGAPPEPHDLWAAWGLEPPVLLGIGAAALLYRRGLCALWRRAGAGRGVTRVQARAYLGGLLALAAALVSPVDALGNALFSAHMLQHLLLVLAAGPLLAAGAPLLVALWAAPAPARRRFRGAWRGAPAGRRAARALVSPLSAWGLHALALWAWHLPALYDLALRSEAAHALEHLSFLATAVLFWWVILPRGGVLRHAPGVGMLYVFTFALQSGVLGALLTLSDRPWYVSHLATTRAWGLTPLEDQQLAGVLMWIPGGLAYLAAVVALFLLLMRTAERRVRRHEAPAALLSPPAP